MKLTKRERQKLIEAIKTRKARITISSADSDVPIEPIEVDLDLNADQLIAVLMNQSKVWELVQAPPLSLTSIVLPERKVRQGTLIKATSIAWSAVARALGKNWDLAYSIPADKWEEIVAGAYVEAGFGVVLTPRSGDHGRDIIATSKGVGCIKIVGSVKAYASGNLVGYDDVRALIGVMSGERDTSKGIISTTSDFPPNIRKDPFIEPFVPTRLELMNGKDLQRWLKSLAQKKTANE